MVVDVEWKQRSRAQVVLEAAAVDRGSSITLAVSEHITLQCGVGVAVTPKVGFM